MGFANAKANVVVIIVNQHIITSLIYSSNSSTNDFFVASSFILNVAIPLLSIFCSSNTPCG